MKPGEILKIVMETNKITQAMLSKEAKVSQPTITRMLKGTQSLNYKVLAVLKNKYKTDINKFF